MICFGNSRRGESLRYVRRPLNPSRTYRKRMMEIKTSPLPRIVTLPAGTPKSSDRTLDGRLRVATGLQTVGRQDPYLSCTSRITKSVFPEWHLLSFCCRKHADRKNGSAGGLALPVFSSISEVGRSVSLSRHAEWAFPQQILLKAGMARLRGGTPRTVRPTRQALTAKGRARRLAEPQS